MELSDKLYNRVGDKEIVNTVPERILKEFYKRALEAKKGVRVSYRYFGMRSDGPRYRVKVSIKNG
tara:strand:- start:655 stop:849 length:195 start_codon:yes stop_codon:yes gene_type:complete